MSALETRVEKLEWYGKYGVREYWLVDPFSSIVSVIDFSGPAPVWRHAKGTDAIRSTVLPDLEASAFGLFA